MKKLLLLSLLVVALPVLALEVTLSWTAVTNSATLWGYQVYYGYETNAINFPAPFVTTNTITVSNLQAVVLTHFQVSAVNSNSIASSRSSIFTVTKAAPAVPSGITTP